MKDDLLNFAFNKHVPETSLVLPVNLTPVMQLTRLISPLMAQHLLEGNAHLFCLTIATRLLECIAN